MKKLVVAGCAALALCAANADNTIAGFNLTLDRVQQRYPWNGLVDIDYTITCEPGVKLGPDENLEVLFIDQGVTNRAISFLQAPLPMTAGTHRITWDAHADRVTAFAESATFQMDVVHYNDVYMVIDVSGGPSASVYPVKFLNAAPVGGFNKDEYKGSNIVLRCIHPGSYMAGSPTDEANRNRADYSGANNETQHRVTLSQPFYIGIFEVTQKQYENVMGASANISGYTGERREYHPVETVSYNTIRGGTWPTTAAPSANSIMSVLNTRCKAMGRDGDYTEPVEGFDLPTEFQWEYACRAGTTGALNTTNAYDNTKSEEQEAQMKLLAIYGQPGGSETGHTVEVGRYQPNQWGLYDMHGNAWEWCRDWYYEKVAELKQFVDPKGNASGQNRVARGGDWFDKIPWCRSGHRNSFGPTIQYSNGGFRLSRTLP